MTLLYIIPIVFLAGALFLWAHGIGFKEGKAESEKDKKENDIEYSSNLPAPPAVVTLPRDTTIFCFDREFHSSEKMTNEAFIQMVIAEFVNCAKKYNCIEVRVDYANDPDIEKWTARMRVLPFLKNNRHGKESR